MPRSARRTPPARSAHTSRVLTTNLGTGQSRDSGPRGVAHRPESQMEYRSENENGTRRGSSASVPPTLPRVRRGPPSPVHGQDRHRGHAGTRTQPSSCGSRRTAPSSSHGRSVHRLLGQPYPIPGALCQPNARTMERYQPCTPYHEMVQGSNLVSRSRAQDRADSFDPETVWTGDSGSSVCHWRRRWHND